MNGDCRVDLTDLILVARIFGSVKGGQGYDPNADLDNDGLIDLADLIAVASNFGQSC